MLSGLSFRSAFFFSIYSVILSGFSLTSFHLAEANLVPEQFLWNKNLFSPSFYSEKTCWSQTWAETYLLFRGFTSLCAQLSKNITKCFLKKSFLKLILKSTYFICITWKRKQTIWNNSRTVDVNEWNQTKTKKTKVTSYSNWPRVLLIDFANKQCSGIIKGWLHCLTSESKGRFLAHDILLAWCLAMTLIQSF